MIDIAAAAEGLLSGNGYSVQRWPVAQRSVVVFENDLVMGFLLTYKNASSLFRDSMNEAEECIKSQRFALRRAGAKAWNIYMLLLAAEPPTDAESAALAALEEDLIGTRKIVRAGITDRQDVRVVLLPLLPLQNPPRLEAVDMQEEIRQRTTQLPARTVDAFLSLTSISSVVHIFEETP